MEKCNIRGAFDEFVESTYSSQCSEPFLLNWEILLLINQSTLFKKVYSSNAVVLKHNFSQFHGLSHKEFKMTGC